MLTYLLNIYGRFSMSLFIIGAKTEAKKTVFLIDNETLNRRL
jgi:hypothetical protein